MPGPYDKFEAAFETFQQELRSELRSAIQEEVKNFSLGTSAAPVNQRTLNHAPSTPASAAEFDPIAFQQTLTTELKTYIDQQNEMLMAMLRRIAIELYETIGDSTYQSGMIEAWRDNPEEEEETLGVCCTNCGYQFTDTKMRFCPQCAERRENVFGEPAKKVISPDLARTLKKEE